MTELDALIEEAGKRGYLWHQFRPDRHGPEALAGVFHWPHCADVVVLTDERGTHAYRTPSSELSMFSLRRMSTGGTAATTAPRIDPVSPWSGSSERC